MNVQRMARLPGVTITGTFTPSSVSPRIKTMAKQILKNGQAKGYGGMSVALAEWAAQHTGAVITRPPYTIKSTDVKTPAQRQAIYEVCNAYVVAQLLKSRTPNSYVPNQLHQVKSDLDLWATGRPYPTTHVNTWQRGRYPELVLTQFGTSARDTILSIMRNPLSPEQQAAQDAAIALLDSAEPITFRIK